MCTSKGEIFIDIPNYEGCYRVSNFGNILSVKRGILLKPVIKKNKHDFYPFGPAYVHLSLKGKLKWFNIYDLMKLAFNEQ